MSTYWFTLPEGEHPPRKNHISSKCGIPSNQHSGENKSLPWFMMNPRMVFVRVNGIFTLIGMRIKIYFYCQLIRMAMVITTPTWCMCIDQEMKKKTYFFMQKRQSLSKNATR